MNKKIRILHITSSFFRGGVESYLLNFLKRADHGRFEHYIFVGRDDGPLKEEYHRLPVKIVTLRTSPKRFFYSIPFGWFFCLKNRIDIIHGHNYWFYRYAYFLSLLTGITLFTSNYGLGLWKRKRQLRLESAVFRRARINTVISKAILEKELELIDGSESSREKFKLIYPIIDDGPMKKTSSYSKEALRSRFGVDNDKPVFTIIGRIDKFKGHRIAIDAMKIINRNGLRVNLFIVGANDDPTILGEEDLEKDYIRYFDYYEDIEEIWAVTDLFLIPSISEGTPLVLVEYFALGKPVIASDISGNAELIEDKQNGFLFKTGDVDDLVKRIEEVIEKDDIGKIGTNAEEFYLKNLAPEKYVAEIESCYRDYS
ncbi:MAG: glycosyltransferase family 4 protein [Candidatus Krumholzibacteriota bacterium]|nr:glycosyltransferase family 4 protein [Candidatus Krumholzibacteriota bacterium]